MIDYVYDRLKKIDKGEVYVPGFYTASSTNKYKDFTRQLVIKSLQRQKVSDPEKMKSILNEKQKQGLRSGDFTITEINKRKGRSLFQYRLSDDGAMKVK